MSFSAENQNPNTPWNKLRPSWLNENKKALDHVISALRRQSLPKQPPKISSQQPTKTLDFDSPQTVSDRTSLLPDQILLRILSKLPESQRKSYSLVSKRWLNLQGRLVRSLRLLDWNFLISGRVFLRFPNLIHVDVLHGSVVSPGNSGGVLVAHEFGYFHVNSSDVPNHHSSDFLPVSEIDSGLRLLASGYPNLRKLVAVNSSEMGLLNVAEECPTLLELVLHSCNDQTLRGIAAFQNLQVLKLIGNVEGFYSSLVSDIGLTILAQGCKRLVKLELRGCEGSYDGIRAIGQCCQMLEELTFCDHRMDDGWLSALSFCENLKTLRFVSCKIIDPVPGLDEHLGFCRTLERLQLEKCQLREKSSIRALFLVCQAIKEIVVENCWGLTDAIFSNASLCRRLRSLSVEGCSRLTTGGLESVILSWKDLRSLRVISCKNVKDSEVTPALSALFSSLKGLKWRPDDGSLLSTSLSGTGMGRKGSKFFKKLQI